LPARLDWHSVADAANAALLVPAIPLPILLARLIAASKLKWLLTWLSNAAEQSTGCDQAPVANNAKLQ